MITRDILRTWGSCYSDERIAELVPETGLTPLQVAALEIPVSDRLWVLLREEIIPARELRLLACLWAHQALDLVPAEQRDPRSLAAIETAERYARGEVTQAELDAARDAAWAAAWVADRDARDAAWAAAWAADRDAWAADRDARAAAWAADRAARAARAARARDAAWDAARAAAAWDAARAAQLADVVDVLRRLEGCE